MTKARRAVPYDETFGHLFDGHPHKRSARADARGSNRPTRLARADRPAHPEGETCFHLFDGPSAETVCAAAAGRGSLIVQRVTRADRPGPLP